MFFGYMDAVQKYHLMPKFYEFDDIADNMSYVIDLMLNTYGIPQAIFTSNDFSAYRAMIELRKRGIDVLKRVHIIGFDDSSEAEKFGFSSVRVYKSELGSFPNGYIEAAKMDGASTLWIIFKVMAPLSRGTISIVLLFTFIGIWDNFMWPLIVIKDYNKMPLSVLLATFNHEYASYVGPLLAGSVLQTIPMVIIFVIFRKHFLKGIAITFK